MTQAIIKTYNLLLSYRHDGEKGNTMAREKLLGQMNKAELVLILTGQRNALTRYIEEENWACLDTIANNIKTIQTYILNCK